MEAQILSMGASVLSEMFEEMKRGICRLYGNLRSLSCGHLHVTCVQIGNFLPLFSINYLPIDMK